jgi:hypothetical protein
LPAGIARRWAGAYGSRSAELLQGVHGLHDLGEDFGGGLHAREVDFLREQMGEADDMLWRRSKLGLRLDAAQVAGCRRGWIGSVGEGSDPRVACAKGWQLPGTAARDAIDALGFPATGDAA